ncbi:MAG: DNA (cytosine-5-)-methyltransferase, partial [Deltaproteobacteria bacterium]|nr:DNA (cytosine-5-)-methyltransferase [Deltaproteobacteria bacterium]
PNFGDIMTINPKSLPDFDLMISGFPCQPFSVVGPRTGFCDPRGHIIFGLIRIMKEKKTKYFIFENVKGLLNHNSGITLQIILKELREAGYKVFWKLVNSVDFGVPQLRERLYFVGMREDLTKDGIGFEFPKPTPKPALRNYLIDTADLEFKDPQKSYRTFLRYLSNRYNRGKFSVEEMLKEEYLIVDTRQSDLRLYRDVVPTLRAGRHGILYVRDGRFRRLSGYEALLLQGWPVELAEKTRGEVEEVTLLGQAGNAMTTNVVEAFGRSLIKFIRKCE